MVRVDYYNARLSSFEPFVEQLSETNRLTTLSLFCLIFALGRYGY
jgi:hypothetical protein